LKYVRKVRISNIESEDKKTKKGGKTVKARGLLYTIAKWLGDYQAVKKGKVGKRIVRRSAGRAAGKGMRKLFK